MRADDDVFVNVERLRIFLRNLNDSEPLFLGQTGVGNQEEFGQLNLNLHENFCMGGPGMIMSRKTLQILAENVEICLKNLQSTHEDVEIGRCVHRFAKTSCTWSYDMQRLFYHNSTLQQNILNHNFASKELYKAITVHPIKDPEAMKILYKYYKRHELQDLNRIVTNSYAKISRSNVQIFDDDELRKLLKFEDVPTFRDRIENLKDVSKMTSNFDNNWQFFGQKIYSEKTVNPRRNMDRDIVDAFQNNLPIIMNAFNRKSMKMSRILDVHSLYYGYMKHDPFIGTQYLLDIAMIYRKYQGKRMTIPIRRHAYAIQTLGRTQVRVLSYPEHKKIVNIVVPLSGRKNILQRFLRNLKNVALVDSRLTLTLVVFIKQNETFVEDLDLSGLVYNIIKLDGQFSRGLALQKSLETFQNDDLLCFLDVDMTFTPEVFERIRRNTIQASQAYFPIVFSQYSDGNDLNLRITEYSGYWRQFGFGIAALYKQDLISVGGFDKNITGWGLEDVALYDRLIQSNKITIFRSIDPELIHVYHPINCDTNLSPKQYEMCLGTFLSSIYSQHNLTDFIEKLFIF